MNYVLKLMESVHVFHWFITRQWFYHCQWLLFLFLLNDSTTHSLTVTYSSRQFTAISNVLSVKCEWWSDKIEGVMALKPFKKHKNARGYLATPSIWKLHIATSILSQNFLWPHIQKLNPVHAVCVCNQTLFGTTFHQKEADVDYSTLKLSNGRGYIGI